MKIPTEGPFCYDGTHIIYLSDYILKNNDKGEYTSIVVIDLQKAFDTGKSHNFN